MQSPCCPVHELGSIFFVVRFVKLAYFYMNWKNFTSGVCVCIIYIYIYIYVIVFRKLVDVSKQNHISCRLPTNDVLNAFSKCSRYCKYCKSYKIIIDMCNIYTIHLTWKHLWEEIWSKLCQLRPFTLTNL